MVNEARVTVRKVVKDSSKKRLSKIADARDTFKDFDHNIEIDCATFGQFSIIDVIEALLEKTGPADVTLATWTAAAFDLSQIEKQLLNKSIRSLRLIIDRSFVSRQPGFVKTILERFGEDSVRTTRTHAKFVVIRNDEWNVVIRTSMNLNHNPRLEYCQVVDDEGLADFWLSISEAIFDEVEPGAGNRRSVPELESLEGVVPSLPIEIGVSPSMGPLVGV